MGKKVKKEVEPLPKDVFDPLLIESKTAATVVLMLSSPEEEVLAKACDALYKFASKGDENKVTLLGLGAVEHLYKLISHEDPIVRRNAIMVFGIMASNHDVKKLLRELDVTNSLISQLAPEAENRKILNEEEVEKCLINLLEIDNNEVKVAASQAISAMCENLASKRAFGLQGIPQLVQLLSSANEEVKEAAVTALANLTAASPSNARAVAEAEGIEPLVNTLNTQRDGAVANAATVLTNLAMQEPFRINIQSRGVMSVLAELLRSTNSQVQSKAAFAVAAFGCDADARTELRNAGGLQPLVELLHSKNEEVQRNVCWAVMVCASDELTAVELCRLGALDILEEINLSTGRKNNFSEAALQKLLDNNLSQKYSQMGYLSPSNIITDGFYDYGQIKRGVKFLSLEELSMQELTDRRAIIFINAKPQEDVLAVEEKAQDSSYEQTILSPSISRKSSREKAGSMVSPMEEKQELSGQRSSLSKSSTREKGLRKGKGKKEEEKMKEVTQIISKVQDEINLENSHWLPPPDFILLDYINDASKAILPLTTTQEQVVALAQFVADKMGGPIERDKLHDFSWELHISEIEFELKCNIVPIGKVKKGTFYHRALLFKVIADRIGIGCSLVRGKYNRAWNEVKLVDDSPQGIAGLLLPPQEYIVDLMFEPGFLMKQGSAEADQYKHI
ncbi:armadillo repeat-containing protein 3 isoform X4 [Aptenodytes patagonicus]|uniref:armadillo repeat-containing protein 3 isoform X4 n=1 Tax=Aptenodytes patagonicus TaxID=9234 RepID=UPI003F9EE1F7